MARVVVGASRPLVVEIARRPEELSRGLSHRARLGVERGMLFDLGFVKDHVFWMRDVAFPLDMIFVGEDGRVAGVLHEVPPMNERLRSIGKPSRWVLEAPAGWARQHGVRTGQTLSVAGLS